MVKTNAGFEIRKKTKGKGKKQENKIHAEGLLHVYKFYKYVITVPLLKIYEQSTCSFLFFPVHRV